MTFLEDIVNNKKLEVETQKRLLPMDDIKAQLVDSLPTRDFLRAISVAGKISLIAEIKRASPSKGVIRAELNPAEIAKIYESSGARAISVITDEKFFQGHLSFLKTVRANSTLPILRKDFIIDEYQIYQSRLAGADAILLITAILSQSQLTDFLAIAEGIGLRCLVEVHSEDELMRVIETPARIIGINNRNLHTFEVDIQTTVKLLPLIPKDRIIVSESGISSRYDVQLLKDCGVQAVLVGESLMSSNDIALKVKQLIMD